jgi:hypothetical protein
LLIDLGRAHLLTNTVEGCHRAHPLYLEALQTVKDRSIHQLRCFHDLAHLEWALAKASRTDPPLFSLYFNLSTHHLREARKRYSLYPDLEQKAAELRSVLLLESSTWLMGSGLRTEWRRYREGKKRDPLKPVDWLVFALSNGDGRFVDRYRAKIREAIEDSGPARSRLEGLRAEVEDLCHGLDERARLLAVRPWLEAVELVLPASVSTRQPGEFPAVQLTGDSGHE